MSFKNQSSELSLEEICAKFLFVIPPEQRQYVWRADNVNELLNDIRDESLEPGQPSAQDEYSGKYIGAIIGYAYRPDNIRADMLSLYDGQQRITTLLILMNALSLALRESGASEDQYNRLREMRKTFIEDKNITVSGDAIKTEKHPLLRPYYAYEKEFFENLQRGDVEQYRKKQPKEVPPLIEAFRTCEAFIAEEFPIGGITSGHLRGDELDRAIAERHHNILRFMDYVAASTKITLVTRSNQDVVRRVFLALNSTGRPLDDLDLVRGYITGLSQSEEEKASVLSFWNSIIGNGKGSQKECELFLVCLINAIRISTEKRKVQFIDYSKIYSLCFSDGDGIIQLNGDPTNSDQIVYKSAGDFMKDAHSIFQIYKRLERGSYPISDAFCDNVGRSLYSIYGVYGASNDIGKTNNRSNQRMTKQSIYAQFSLLCCVAHKFPDHANIITDMVFRYMTLYKFFLLGSFNGAASRNAPFNADFHTLRSDILSNKIQDAIGVIQRLSHTSMTDDVIKWDLFDKFSEELKRKMVWMIYLAVEMERAIEAGGDLKACTSRENYDIEHVSPKSHLQDFRNNIGNFLLLEGRLNKQASDKNLNEKLSIYTESELFINQLLVPRLIPSKEVRGQLTMYESNLLNMRRKWFPEIDANQGPTWNREYSEAMTHFYADVLKDILARINRRAINAR